jgi:hypothetical protein
MVHLLSERYALITDALPQLYPPLLFPLPLWLILKQCADALRIQYRYHLISIKKGLVHRTSLSVALLALIK